MSRRPSQQHACSAALRVDELDARQFKSPLNDIKGRPTRGADPCLKLSDGHHPDPRFVSQVLLGPIEQTAGSAALCWRDHGRLNSTILLFLAK
jgi:hypothetical protein